MPVSPARKAKKSGTGKAGNVNRKGASSKAAKKSGANAPTKAAKPAKAPTKTARSVAKASGKKAATKPARAAGGKAAKGKVPARPARPSGKASKPTKAAKPAPPKTVKGSRAARTVARPGHPAARKAPIKPLDTRFLEEQRDLLVEERATYLGQAEDLKAEADSLVQEMEPGDVQFDEESGEGGTVTVDRERDLALSAQAMVAVEEINHAIDKIDLGTYGVCENCGDAIPRARLRALPYARLCVACKSGGLSRR